MHHFPRQIYVQKRTKPEFINWINTLEFQQFVTLAFNGRPNTYGRPEPSPYHRERLKKWDAMLNHAIWGKGWHTKFQPQLMASFWFMEKADTNPHWHGLIGFVDHPHKPIAAQLESFNANVGPKWRKLVPSGTTDSKHITDKPNIINYVCKSVPNDVDFDRIVLPRQFRLH